MKTAEEILRETRDDLRPNVIGWGTEVVVTAMKRYAEEYYLERLRAPKPKICKGCMHWTVIDALGGEYCRVLEKSVASPRPDYKHKDCPL